MQASWQLAVGIVENGRIPTQLEEPGRDCLVSGSCANDNEREYIGLKTILLGLYEDYMSRQWGSAP